MLLDVTEWHDVAAGRGSLCDWMMEGAAYFSEIGNLGGEVLVTTYPHPHPPSSPFIYLRKFIFEMQSRNFLGQNKYCLMHHERIFVISSESAREKYFSFLFTHFCLDLSIMIDVTSDRSIFWSCY